MSTRDLKTVRICIEPGYHTPILLTVLMPEFQLYVSVSEAVSPAGLNHLIQSSDWWEHPRLAGIYVTRCCEKLLRDKCLEWSQHLKPSDLELIRCHVTQAETDPTPGRLMHSRNMQWLLDWLNGQWLHDLLRADRLVTYFQPIVDLTSRSRIFAFECLARGQDPQGSIIPPNLLFQAARATGQLANLDHAAQLKAVRTAAQRKLGTYIFINIAPWCLDASAATLERTIRTSVTAGLNSDRLVFEVVESDKLEDLDLLARVLSFCREAGSRVALDDVGAGYNSLSLMAEVRPDFIKIDRELIRGADRDLFKCRVVSKLIELANELGIATVVEGIETKAEWEWAMEQGAHYAQGFLFGKPTPDPRPATVDSATHGIVTVETPLVETTVQRAES